MGNERTFFLLPFLLLLCPRSVLPATFTVTNNCGDTIWPGLLSNAGTAQLPTTGFALSKGQSRELGVPHNWSGRIWARSLCSTSGGFTCASGDCGSGAVECSGGGAAPPATLAEFTLSGAGGLDFYDVSLVDGYNLPVLVVPRGGKGGNCTATGCLVDLNGACPSELKVTTQQTGGEGVACKSACEAFRTPEYCCSGEYGNPSTCKPTAYSQFFKNACPRAYSYAYDDSTSTFTCGGAADYFITFCPSTSTMKGQNPQAALPLVNGSMVYLGGQMVSAASWDATVSWVASMVVAVATSSPWWWL